MKTRTYLSFAGITLLFLTTACQSSSDKNGKESGDSENSQATSLLDNTSTQTTFKHTIPIDAMKAMINTYETERAAVLSSNTALRKARGENFVDSKNAWISLEELISFVEEVKASGKNSGLSVKDIGVRFYFTVYPDRKDGESAYFNDIEKDYRNKQTFLLLPTYHDNSSNTEKDILSSQQTASKAKSTGEAFSTDDQNAAAPAQFFSAAAGSGVALNHMALCPPACTN